MNSGDATTLQSQFVATCTTLDQFRQYCGKSPAYVGVEELRRFQLHMPRKQKLAVGTVEIRQQEGIRSGCGVT